MKGISNKTMDVLLRTTTEGIDAVTVEQKISALTAAFDIAGAINRLSLEMREFPEDIIHAFADSEGKIFSSLSRDEFMRYLYNATESLSKADVQVEFCCKNIQAYYCQLDIIISLLRWFHC